MGESGSRKRSKKKSKRSKRGKASKRTSLSKGAPPTEQTQPGPQNDQPDAEPVLSEASQLLVIELQRTELSRLLREHQRLNDRIDRLLQLHEREQVLRQQMQAALDNLAARQALPSPDRNEPEHARLVERVTRAEGKYSALQTAVGLLVVALERRTVAGPMGRRL